MGAITITFELPAHFLDVRSQRAGFVLLASFLLSFLFIRTSARLMRSPKVPWWPGSVTTEGGLHLHHLVWGIVLMLLSGFLEFATSPVSPWNEILAAMFGVGAGFTLDEFALWVYLRDVYWAEEGRSSFDAVVVAALIGGLVVLGLSPFDLPDNGSSISAVALAVDDCGAVERSGDPQGQAAARPDRSVRAADLGRRCGTSGSAELTLGATAL